MHADNKQMHRSNSAAYEQLAAVACNACPQPLYIIKFYTCIKFTLLLATFVVQEFFEAAENLWNDQGVQRCYKHSDVYQNDSVP